MTKSNEIVSVSILSKISFLRPYYFEFQLSTWGKEGKSWIEFGVREHSKEFNSSKSYAISAGFASVWLKSSEIDEQIVLYDEFELDERDAFSMYICDGFLRFFHNGELLNGAVHNVDGLCRNVCEYSSYVKVWNMYGDDPIELKISSVPKYAKIIKKEYGV